MLTAPLRPAVAIGAPAICARRCRVGLPRSCAVASDDASGNGVHLLLYTKPDCPLCDGLKDKINALIARAEFMPCCLSRASLEVRDISTNAAWQDELHLSVPVLAALDNSGREVVLPRPPPRMPADRLQQHLETALQQQGVLSGGGEGAIEIGSSGGGSDEQQESSGSAGWAVVTGVQDNVPEAGLDNSWRGG